MYLARHGETSTNTLQRFSGAGNPSLTPSGIEQARKMGKALVYHGITSIYTSDLTRAVETSTLVSNKIGARIVQIPELRERHIGDWQGKTPTELEDLHGPDWYSNKPLGGEALGEFNNRLHEAFTKIAADVLRLDERNFVVITHGGPIVALHRMLGRNPDLKEVGFGVPNAKYDVISVRPSGKKLLD